MLTSRRSLITGLVSLMAAPAIVRAGSLMPVRPVLLLPEMHYLSRPSLKTEGTIIRYAIFDERDSCEFGYATYNVATHQCDRLSLSLE